MQETGDRKGKGKGKMEITTRRRQQQRGMDSEEMEEQPVASTSKARQMADSERKDEDEEDATMMEDDIIDDDNEESPKKQPFYSQYMGDSEVDEDDDDSGDDEQRYGDNAGSDQESANSDTTSDQADAVGQANGMTAQELEQLKEEMQRIPLKTLLRAQKRLASSSSSTKSSKKPGENGIDIEDTGTANKKQRKGREASRRGMAPDLLKPAAELLSERKGKGKVKQHRDNKHAPTEMSSKRTVSRNRTVVEVQASNRRDPRFDNLTGSYDPRLFQESYAFLSQARQDEIKRLQYALRATKRKGGAVDAVEREAMAQELAQLHTKQAAADKEKREKTVVNKWKEQESKKQDQGKRSFFLKAAERKKLLEDSRMADLQKNKRKLRKVMDKKKSTEKRKDFRSAPPMRQT